MKAVVSAPRRIKIGNEQQYTRKASKPNKMLAWKFFANSTKLSSLKRGQWNGNYHLLYRQKS